MRPVDTSPLQSGLCASIRRDMARHDAKPLPPIAPDIAALLNGRPAVDAARIAKANRRARRAEIMVDDLTGEQLVRSEKVRASILSHRPDPAYLEDLWGEIEAALGTEAGMRLTLEQLVQQAADKRALAEPLPSPG